MEDADDCIRVGVGNFMPHIITGGNATHPIIRGTILELFESIGHKLGRCVRYIMEPNNMGGIKLPNGTWTGIMGMLQRDVIDITTIGILSHARTEVCDWTEYLYMEEHTVSYRRPVIESDIGGFYKPFSWEVWLWVALVLAVMPTCHTLLRKARQRLPRPQESRVKTGDHQEQPPAQGNVVHDSLMWTVSALLAQSLPLRTPRGVVKVLTGLWLLLALILVTVYRSNLKAMLILPKLNLPFDSLEELTNTRIPVWVSISSVLHAAALDGEKDSTMGRFNLLINSVGKPNNVSQAIVELLAGLQALGGPRSALVQIIHAHFAKTGNCSLYLMSQSFLKTNIGCLFLQKNSPLKDKVDPIISNWREFGILDRMYRRGVAKAEECLKPISARLDSWRTLSLGDFYGVFLVYAGGVVIAVVVFMIEVTFGKSLKTHKNQRMFY
ncbi:glutamate receptor ionotropic, kainate glr-3-like isoform X2 [Eriocheir sinensis]|uniref:glutamate receptor ionotropic, kainate glr-3-like isoform X2 n=1 Tax=Eriocheir sinensis TaxID=95602 RepID=UPI0021CA63F0|nr:glutamate receptor ionotropic, kainate glr-3-like isoform X2 [Eriocheir sinensis]